MKKVNDIQWYVDFANLNLEEITLGDKAKLLVESEEYLFPKEELEQLEKWPDASGMVLPLSKEQRKTVAWALPENIPSRDSNEYWNMILNLQSHVRTLFKKYIVPTAQMVAIRGTIETHYMVYRGKDKPFTILFFPIGSQEDYIGFKLFRLLEGFESHTIRVCPGCDKFFFNPTRKKKEFCGPKCMWKVSSERRRENLKKDPRKYRAYLKKQREIMRQRYERLQKSRGYKKINRYKRKGD